MSDGITISCPFQRFPGVTIWMSELTGMVTEIFFNKNVKNFNCQIAQGHIARDMLPPEDPF